MALSKRRVANLSIWIVLIAAMAVPVLLATASPYLAYRNFAYILGGFAGIIGLALFVVQPLLAAGYLPGAGIAEERRWHRWLGATIVACVALHLGGLFVTSPPDTLDALMLVAPTPFSVYGVVAMWGIVATALLVGFRGRLGLGNRAWNLVHNGLALVVVVATVVHALQIEGAMEIVSKWALCLLALATTGITLFEVRVIRPILRSRRKGRRPARKAPDARQT
jgi:predicted ferric reductase